MSNTGLFDPNCHDHKKQEGHLIDVDDPGYRFVANYIHALINGVDLEQAKELETAVLAGEFDPSKYKPADISKARKIANATGRRGELLIDAYLKRLLANGEISGYTWMNKDEESFTPYDFQIVNKDGEILYVDVKSTGYNFGFLDESCG